MRLQVECRTRFDISPTGIRNHHSANGIPGLDDLGQAIPDQRAWIRARNQQRNWDTVNQIISLRCLPENISSPEKIQEGLATHWRFQFEIANPAAVALSHDPVGLLLADSRDVPMITGLGEDAGIAAVLDPAAGGNISFQPATNK